ncbi:MAG: hypothetical protein SGBAC_005611 [Bacillariaceae sp.]
MLPLTMSLETADEYEKKAVLAKKSKVPNNKNNRRKVQFNERVKGRSILSIPKEERKHVWYTSAYYDEASKNERILRICISNNDQLYKKNQENLNAQGVITEQQSLKMDAAVKASTSAVFEEQERQENKFFRANKSGKFRLDCERIANAYRVHSREAHEQAQLRAARHEQHLSGTGIDTKSSPSSPPCVSKKGIATRLSPTSLFGMRKLISRPSAFVANGPLKRTAVA